MTATNEVSIPSGTRRSHEGHTPIRRLFIADVSTKRARKTPPSGSAEQRQHNCRSFCVVWMGSRQMVPWLVFVRAESWRVVIGVRYCEICRESSWRLTTIISIVYFRRLRNEIENDDSDIGSRNGNGKPGENSGLRGRLIR